MFAHYGYEDASGRFFITIDTDRCDGCGACLDACPRDCFVVFDEDPNDPFRETPVAVVADDRRKQLNYLCGPCKPASDRPPLPCMTACPHDAIEHSW